MSDFGVMGLGVGCVENGTVTRMVNETKKTVLKQLHTDTQTVHLCFLSTLFNGTLGLLHPRFLRMYTAQGWMPDHSWYRNVCTQTNIGGGMSV
jgi:hypothetical protein